MLADVIYAQKIGMPENDRTNMKMLVEPATATQGTENKALEAPRY
jgi:hypothetical protein